MAQETLSQLVVDLWVTGRCDMDCPFCYGANKPADTTRGVIYNVDGIIRPELTLSQMKSVIQKLRAVGVTTLTVSGGEPLLRGDLVDLLGFINEQGLQVYLSTNGTFLLRQYSSLQRYISILGLPLDGASADINVRMGRRKYHFQNIEKILRYFHIHPPQHKVKIGTIVSKINLHNISEIANLLYRTDGIYSPDVWRLYQFEPLKEGKRTQEQYEIDDDDFLEICGNVINSFPAHDISIRSRSAHYNAYFFVTPDGLLQTVTTQHVTIADMLTVDEQSLRLLMNERKDTMMRVAENRKWLDDSLRVLGI